MVDIHPVEHVRPLPATKRVTRDEDREKRREPDSQAKNEKRPANDADSPPHIDDYA
jgi:hypothetical protein